MAAQKTGVPLVLPEGDGPGGLPTDWGNVLKQNVLDWAHAELQNRVSSSVANAVAGMDGLADLEGLAGRINERLNNIGSLQCVDVRGLAMELAEQVAGRAVNQFQVAAKDLGRKSRRQLQLRAAQQRFREKWGNRASYLSVK